MIIRVEGRESIMQHCVRLCILITFLLMGTLCSSFKATAEESDSLHDIERRIAERYDRLELLAGRLAELSRSTQPRRSSLLRELISKSREKDLSGRFAETIALLEKNRLGKALNGQQEIQGDLELLLNLLLQEDRDRQLESQRKRIGKYLEEVKKLIRQQRGIEARTEGGDTSRKIIDDQERTARAAEKLRSKIESTEDLKSVEEGSSSTEDGSKKNSKPSMRPMESGGSNDSEGEQNKGSSEDEKPSQAPKNGQENQKPGDAKAAENGAPSSEAPGAEKSEDSQGSGSQSKPGDGKQGQQGSSPQSSDDHGSSQDGANQNQQKQSPMERATARLRRAQQRMEQAKKKLKEAERENALEKQREALRELEQAKAELERILRQLREEEMERMLVLLEARIRKMLKDQTEVYEETLKLSANVDRLPTHELEISTGRLRRREESIAQEADRALLLLREDGTSVAFPEAIEQARGDMLSVALRLSEVKVGIITQGLEEDIIEALEETLTALQKALKDLREQKSQPQQGGGQSGDQPLVDQLAELRMIAALQNRINRRTRRYGELLGDDFALEEDLRQALAELARRQERVFDATKDLESGKNR